MRNTVGALPLLLLILLLQNCSQKNEPFVHVNANATINMRGHENLNLTAFNFQFDALVNTQDSFPVFVRFDADPTVLFPTVWKVKENMRKYSGKVMLKIPAKNGGWIIEKIERALTKREEQGFDHLEERNIFSLYVGADQELFTDPAFSKPFSGDLSAYLKKFIKSDPNDENLPELSQTFLPGVGAVNASKHHQIRIVPTMTTPYDWYLEIRQEVDAAYLALRDELSQAYFYKSYQEANKAEQTLMNIVYPSRVADDPNIVE